MEKLVEARSVTGSSIVARRRPWQRLVAMWTPVVGLVLLWHVASSGAPSVTFSAAAVLAAASLELAVGLGLGASGRGAVHVFAAFDAFAIALIFGGCGVSSRLELTAAPVALALGLFCLNTGAMRAIDLAVEGYDADAATLRGIDCAFRVMLGLLLVVRWRLADAELIGLSAALLMIGSGFPLACAALKPAIPAGRVS